jgi:hypothetical protein
MMASQGTQAQIGHFIKQALTAATKTLQIQIDQVHFSLHYANNNLANAQEQISALQAAPPI